MPHVEGHTKEEEAESKRILEWAQFLANWEAIVALGLSKGRFNAKTVSDIREILNFFRNIYPEEKTLHVTKDLVAGTELEALWRYTDPNNRLESTEAANSWWLETYLVPLQRYKESQEQQRAVLQQKEISRRGAVSALTEEQRAQQIIQQQKIDRERVTLIKEQRELATQDIIRTQAAGVQARERERVAREEAEAEVEEAARRPIEPASRVISDFISTLSPNLRGFAAEEISRTIPEGILEARAEWWRVLNQEPLEIELEQRLALSLEDIDRRILEEEQFIAGTPTIGQPPAEVATRLRLEKELAGELRAGGQIPADMFQGARPLAATLAEITSTKEFTDPSFDFLIPPEFKLPTTIDPAAPQVVPPAFRIPPTAVPTPQPRLDALQAQRNQILAARGSLAAPPFIRETRPDPLKRYLEEQKLRETFLSLSPQQRGTATFGRFAPPARFRGRRGIR